MSETSRERPRAHACACAGRRLVRSLARSAAPLAVAAALSTACTGSEGGAGTRGPGRAGPPASASRSTAIDARAPTTPLDSASPSRADDDDRPNSAAANATDQVGVTPAGPNYLLGAVEEAGVMHCPPPDHRIAWLDLHPQLGFVDLWNTDARQIAGLLGKPALARGRVATAPTRPPIAVELTPCPEAQMRSDWVMGPRGVRHRHDPSPPVAGFRVDSLRELTELRAARVLDGVRVDFANPLPLELADLQLVLHYEGCYGKPGAREHAHAVASLAPGEAVTHTFPAFAEDAADAGLVRGRPARHAASSIRVLARSDDAVFDLDVGLAQWGAAVDCPER